MNISPNKSESSVSGSNFDGVENKSESIIDRIANSLAGSASEVMLVVVQEAKKIFPTVNMAVSIVARSKSFPLPAELKATESLRALLGELKISSEQTNNIMSQFNCFFEESRPKFISNFEHNIRSTRLMYGDENLINNLNRVKFSNGDSCPGRVANIEFFSRIPESINRVAELNIPIELDAKIKSKIYNDPEKFFAVYDALERFVSDPTERLRMLAENDKPFFNFNSVEELNPLIELVDSLQIDFLKPYLFMNILHHIGEVKNDVASVSKFIKSMREFHHANNYGYAVTESGYLTDVGIYYIITDLLDDYSMISTTMNLSNEVLEVVKKWCGTEVGLRTIVQVVKAVIYGDSTIYSLYSVQNVMDHSYIEADLKKMLNKYGKENAAKFLGLILASSKSIDTKEVSLSNLETMCDDMFNNMGVRNFYRYTWENYKEISAPRNSAAKRALVVVADHDYNGAFISVGRHFEALVEEGFVVTLMEVENQIDLTSRLKGLNSKYDLFLLDAHGEADSFALGDSFEDVVLLNDVPNLKEELSRVMKGDAQLLLDSCSSDSTDDGMARTIALDTNWRVQGLTCPSAGSLVFIGGEVYLDHACQRDE